LRDFPLAGTGHGVSGEVEVVSIEATIDSACKAASGPRAASGEVEGNEPSQVTKRTFRTGPEPEVVIESGRGPDGPTIHDAPGWLLARIRSSRSAPRWRISGPDRVIVPVARPRMFDRWPGRTS
jgi:hypothetical protein